MEQAEIRRIMIEKRKGVTPQANESAGKAVARQVLALPEVEKASGVMVYLPVSGELDTHPLIHALNQAKKTVLYPVTVGETMVAAQPLTDAFIKGDFGVSVPEKYAVFPNPDVVIVPLTAADIRRFRVGYGKGYYDKFLAQTGAFSVGVCHHFQIVEGIRENPWENPLNVLVSEQAVLR